MAESKINPEIRIRPSKGLLDFVRNHVDENSPKIPKNILSESSSITFSISEVTWIQSYMSENQSELQKSWPDFKFFHQLMEESSVILPEPEIPPRYQIINNLNLIINGLRNG